MKEKKTDLDGALKWIGATHDQVATQFLDDSRQIPSFGDPILDAEVATYIYGLGAWVRANTEWSFEVSAPSGPTFASHIDMFFDTQTPRYFGLKAHEIKVTRTVALLPKRVIVEAGNPAEQGQFADSEGGGMSSCRHDLNAVCFIDDEP
jgi:hypothetical protein